MSGLVLKLSPKERIIVNGAVIENGDRRSRLAVLTPGANILRLRDAIHPDDANTPVRRVCYTAQLAVSGDADPESVRPQLMQGIEQLLQVFDDTDCRDALDRAATAVTEGEFYSALRALRLVLAQEDRILSLKGE